MGFASLWHARTCFEDFWHISQHVMASAPLLHRHSQASLRGVGNLFLFWPGALMSIKHHHYTGLPVGAAWETLRHGLTFWFCLVHLRPKPESNTKHVPKAEIASQNCQTWTDNTKEGILNGHAFTNRGLGWPANQLQMTLLCLFPPDISFCYKQHGLYLLALFTCPRIEAEAVFDFAPSRRKQIEDTYESINYFNTGVLLAKTNDRIRKIQKLLHFTSA